MAGFTSMNRVKTEESEAEITNGIPPRAEPVHSSSNGHSANGPNGHAQIPPALKEEDSNDTSDTSAASSPETITQDTKPAPAPPLPPPQQQPPAPSTLQTAAPPQPHYDPHIDPMIAGLAGTNNPAQQSSASPPQPAKRATEEPSDQRLKVAKLEHQYVPRSPAGSPSTSPQMYNMSPQQYYMGGQPPPPPPPGAYSNDSNSNHSPRHHHHPHPQTIPATHVMGNPILPQYASPQGSQHPYNPFLYPQSRSRANPPLDMGSVDGRGTTKQRFEAGSSTRSDSRFKLEHVPTVYPTLEDFENRPKYMETLERYYGKYGMVKIVPPERWNVHFRLDTEMFWFKTRRQDLNSSNQGRSAKDCFKNDLFQFHQQHKTPIIKLPSIDKRPIDVYHLFHCVHLRGGFVEVCRRKLWAQVGRELGYSGKIMTSLSTSLKSSYQKILYPFDQFLETNQGPKKYRPVMPLANYFLPAESAVKKSANDQKFSPVAGSNLLLLREGRFQLVTRALAGCEEEQDHFALKCTQLPHKAGYAGIELTPADSKNAASYNLRQFQQKCERFDEKYFGPRPKPVGLDGENFVEKEYWEALSHSGVAVEVEYGSNIHSAIHGSTNAMPEQNSLRNVNDQWNLNVAPLQRDGMFQYIQDASAQQLRMPWLHVGMMFSSRAWAVEDMLLWSLDYLHFGSTRTWYVISPKHYDKFQKLLERYGKGDRKVDSKFILEPDLMISPEVLKEEGIETYLCDQRPGEYVLSFPKSYRSHFCHGFNMSESVNLCPVTWLQGPAQECADLYARNNQLPAFSYVRMMVDIAKNGRIHEKAMTGQYLMREIEKEQKARKTMREYRLKEEAAEPASGEEVFCALTAQPCVFSYLSAMDDHQQWESTYALDSGPKINKKDCVMKLFYSDEELEELLKEIKVNECDIRSQWEKKLKETMEKPLPDLHECRELLYEGQIIDAKHPEVYHLQQFVCTCEHWVSRARAFLDQGKKTFDRKDREGPADREPDVPRVTREEVTLLVDGFNQMPFTCRESVEFFDCLRNLEQLASDVQYALHDPNCNYTPIEYIRLVHEVRHASIAIPYTDQLYQVCNKLRWCEKALGMIDRSSSDMIQQALREGDLMGFNMSEIAYRQLMNHLQYVLAQPQGYVPLLLKKEETKREDASMDSSNESLGSAIAVDDDDDSKDQSDEEVSHVEVYDTIPVEVVVPPKEFLKDPLPSASIIPRPASLLPEYKLVDIAAALEDNTELETAGDPSLSIEYSELCIELGSDSIQKRPPYNVARDLCAMADSEDHLTLPTLQQCMKSNEEWLKRCKALFNKRTGPHHFMLTRLASMYRSVRFCLALEDTYERDVKALEAEEKKEYLEDEDAKLFCFCRQRESGVMVGCDKCREWYHSKCLKSVGLRTKSYESFICHVCDHHLETHWETYRPTLTELDVVFQQSHWLPLQCDELPVLQAIIHLVSEFENMMDDKVIKGVTPEDSKISADEARFYLRKLEGLELVLPSATNFFRQVIWNKDPVGDKPPPTAEETVLKSRTKKGKPAGGPRGRPPRAGYSQEMIDKYPTKQK